MLPQMKMSAHKLLDGEVNRARKANNACSAPRDTKSWGLDRTALRSAASSIWPISCTLTPWCSTRLPGSGTIRTCITPQLKMSDGSTLNLLRFARSTTGGRLVPRPWRMRIHTRLQQSVLAPATSATEARARCGLATIEQAVSGVSEDLSS